MHVYGEKPIDNNTQCAVKTHEKDDNDNNNAEYAV